MAYPKTEPKADFTALEHKIMEFWRRDDTFHKSLNKTKQGHPFSFYDGPPFGNGLPHCVANMLNVHWVGIAMDYPQKILLKKSKDAMPKISLQRTVSPHFVIYVALML